MSFLARLVSNNSRSLKKWVGGTVLTTTPRKQFLHGVWVLVDSYLRIRFDLLSSIKLFPQIASQKPLLEVAQKGPKGYNLIIWIWFSISK